MAGYSAKVHHDVGGDSITVEAGGSIKFGNVTMSVDASGKLIFSGLPAADPLVAGAVWNNAGVVTVSTGS